MQGKTLQALVGVAIAHVDEPRNVSEVPKSLVICPSSVVGHWAAEIEKFFPEESIFRTLAYIGTELERKSLQKSHFAMCNIIVTSYSVLRSDVEALSPQLWRCVILDEGHLLKNPRTGEFTVINPMSSVFGWNQPVCLTANGLLLA